MATRNNNLSVIPFYESLAEQDFRLWYAYGERYSHYVGGGYLVPFFFCLPKVSGRTIIEVQFFEACCNDRQAIEGGSFDPTAFSEGFQIYGDGERDYEQAILANGLSIHTIGDYDVITYPANHVTALNLPKGFYYIKVITSDGIVRYSDIFCSVPEDSLGRFTKIEWFNNDDLKFEGGVIPYGEVLSFKNILYVDSSIGKPEYNFTEEGEERNGYFFAIKQISEKTYRMNFIAPEFLCDAMRLIRMSDRVKVTDELGRTYQCDSFLVSASWLEQGHYANVECEFQTDSVVKMIGKAYGEITDR